MIIIIGASNIGAVLLDNPSSLMKGMPVLKILHVIR